MAINVAHQLREMDIPVYFASLRGMESKDELVSKLLSIFTDPKQVRHFSPAHWLTGSLKQLQNPFVLILDNADDLLESGDTRRKEQVLLFINEILAQCNHIKLLFTTRESLDYLNHKLPIHLERVGALDEDASGRLVRFLLPDLSDDDCSNTVKVCGQVPLAMRLMCSTMREENISLQEFLDELKSSSLIDVLDNESFSDDARLKKILHKSFQRLTDHEKAAFVSLAVFLGWFGIEEATVVSDVKTDLQMKKIVRSLERKSLIDCSEDFASFTVHSLLRSFVDDRRRTDQETAAVFDIAQRRFYSYHISAFGVANEKFLTGHSSEALTVFLSRRESIITSLLNGPRDDELYPKAVEVLSRAELFLFAVLSGEELLFWKLFNAAVAEARKRQNVDDELKLLAAKSFGHWGWFSPDRQTRDHSLWEVNTDAVHLPAKLLCYFGINQLLCGKLDEGISSLKSAVDRLSSCCDEAVLKVLVFQTLATSHSKKQDHEMASYFNNLFSIEAKAISACVGGFVALSDDARPSLEDDTFFCLLTSILLFMFEPKWFGCCRGLFHAMDVLARVCYGTGCKNWSIVNIEQMWGLCLHLPDEVKTAFESFSTLLDFNNQMQVSNDCSITVQITSAMQQMCDLMEKISIQNVTGSAAFLKQIFKVAEDSMKSEELVLVSSEDIEWYAKFYDMLGKGKRMIGDYSGALVAHQEAITVREVNFGDHVDTVSSLTSIGCVYFKMNNENEAVKSFQSALGLRKRLGVYDHVDTATVYCTLGENHLILGSCEKAIEAYLLALELRRKHLGNHPITGESLHHLAVMYHQMRNFSSAVEEFQKASDMRSNLLGDHKDTALSYHCLGLAQSDMGNLSRALESLKKALQIRKKCFLGDHLDIADSIHEIGCVFYKMGDYQSARKNFHDALELYQKLLGEHQRTANSCHFLSKTYLAIGFYTKASRFCKQAITMINGLLLEQVHAAYFHTLGCISYKMGNFPSAVEAFQKASDIRSNLLGDHKDTAMTYHWLGLAQRKVRDVKGALESLQNASRMRKEILGDHPSTANSFSKSGRLYYKIGKYHSARQQFQNALDVYQQLPEKQKSTASSCYNLAVTSRAMGSYPEALEFCQQASTMRLELLGEHVKTANSFHVLGSIYYKISDIPSAVEAFQKASDMRINLLGDHKDTALSKHRLGKAQWDTGDVNGALASLHAASSMRNRILVNHPDTAKSLPDHVCEALSSTSTGWNCRIS